MFSRLIVSENYEFVKLLVYRKLFIDLFDLNWSIPFCDRELHPMHIYGESFEIKYNWFNVIILCCMLSLLAHHLCPSSIPIKHPFNSSLL